MELKNCIKCNRTFGAAEGQETCSKCSADYIEEDFRKIRDYLYDYPGADVKEVSEATGASELVILRLLKEGRIEIVKDKTLIRRCEKCKKIVQSGRICPECKNSLAQDLKELASSLKPSLDDGFKKEGMGYHHKKR